MLYQWMKEKRQIQNNNRIKKQAENDSSESVFGLFLFNNKYCFEHEIRKTRKFILFSRHYKK